MSKKRNIKPDLLLLPEWKEKAVGLFPDLRSKIEEVDFSPYALFLDLLRLCGRAHAGHADWQLKKIYDLAEWCFHQEDFDVSNAVCVMFYEHLVDDGHTRAEIPLWISPDIFPVVYGLSEWHTSPEILEEVKARYIEQHPEAEALLTEES